MMPKVSLGTASAPCLHYAPSALTARLPRDSFPVLSPAPKPLKAAGFASPTSTLERPLMREVRTPRPPVVPGATVKRSRGSWAEVSREVASTPRPMSATPTPRQASMAPQGPGTPQHGAAAMTPRGKREASGASEPVSVLGTGAGGAEELARHLDSGAVSWAVLRFQVGSGTFARSKLVIVHCNGADAPVMLRGWLKERVNEVVPLFGEVHANLEIAHPEELTVEYLCERLLPLFAADDIQYSLQALRADYGKTVAEMQAEAAELELVRLDSEYCSARECDGPLVSREEALRGVGEDRGSYNWALFEPTRLQLHNAGYGGLEEMQRWLAHDKVLFGVLRLSFGCSDRQGGTGVRVTKHMFVHWVGSSVGIVRRGKWNAKLNEATALICSQFAVAFRREAHSVADLRLPDLVGELRRLTHVDGSAAKDGMAVGRVSSEEYLAALSEELRDRKAAVQAKADEMRQRKEEQRRWLSEGPASGVQEVKSVVEVVRAPCGRFNWALCGWPKQAAAPPAAPLLPPKAGPSPSLSLPLLLGAAPSPCRARLRGSTPKVTATPVPKEK